MAAGLPLKGAHPSFNDETDQSNIETRMRLQFLIEKTYEKMDELTKLFAQETSILKTGVNESNLEQIVQRQKRIMQVSSSVLNKDFQNFSGMSEKHPLNENSSSRSSIKKHKVSFKIDEMQDAWSFKGNSPNSDNYNIHPEREPREYEDGPTNREVDPSWYGSLDRNFSKKNKQGAMDRKRRHTKTIGTTSSSMAGLDHIKITQELRPDQQYQYEIGLPRVTSYPSSKLSTMIHATLSSQPQLPKSHFIDGVLPLFMRPPLPLPVDTGIKYSADRETFSNQIRKGDQGIFNLSQFMNARSQYQTGVTEDNESNSKVWFETDLDGRNNSPQISPMTRTSALNGSISCPGISSFDFVDGGIGKLNLSSLNEDDHSKSSGSNESQSSFNNKESTKPFEMTDYYKYSTKFRNATFNGSMAEPRNKSYDLDFLLRISPRPKEDEIRLPQNFQMSKSRESLEWMAEENKNITESMRFSGVFVTPDYDAKRESLIELFSKESLKGDFEQCSLDEAKSSEASKEPEEEQDFEFEWASLDEDTKRTLLEELFSPSPKQEETHKTMWSVAGPKPVKLVNPKHKPPKHLPGKKDNDTALPPKRLPRQNCYQTLPDLPPRLPRDGKNEQGSVSISSQECGDNGQAWVMDTPTYV